LTLRAEVNAVVRPLCDELLPYHPLTIGAIAGAAIRIFSHEVEPPWQCTERRARILEEVR
jgi:hypothetical protein